MALPFFNKKTSPKDEPTTGAIALPEQLPQHVGFIMDGNGRWAKKRGMPRKFGHREGAKTFRAITRHAKALGIQYITYYAFSTENWKRSVEEVSTIMNIFRKYLVDNNFIDCIIQLPSNLFFGTSIATCIMVLKKGKTDNKVLFIDASSECVKVTNNNKLTPENINKIVETFAQRAEEAHFSHLAEYSEVQENDYNLSVSTYVEAKDTREKIDIVKLNAEIAQIVARENELRAAIDQIVAEIEG